MTTDAILLAVACVLALVCLASIVLGIVLFVKKKPIWGAIAVSLALVVGLIAIATFVLLGLSTVQWD